MSEEGRSIIDIAMVYTELVRLIGHMEGIDTRNKAADAIHSDHEARLRLLERWRYALPASLLIALGSVAIAVVQVVQK
jgi:hypothetical protein